MTNPLITAVGIALTALAASSTAAAQTAGQPAWNDPARNQTWGAAATTTVTDTVVLSTDEYRNLLGRIEALERVLGPDVQLGVTLQNLKARVDGLEAGGVNGGMNVRWKDGLRFEDEDVQFKIGGRIHFDNVFASGDDDLEESAQAAGEDDLEHLQDGTEFRNTRLYIQGSIYDQHEFKAQYNFSGGDADFKDVYMKFKQIPVIDNLTVGQFKEPFSLEELTSSNYGTFAERSVANALVPGRSAGLGTDHSWNDGAVNWAMGVFRDGSDDNGVSMDDGNGAFTTRLAGTPVYQLDGERFLHLGASYTTRSVKDDDDGDPNVDFGVRPEVHKADKLVEAEFQADGVDVTGFEAAFQDGPFSIQAEQITAQYDADDADDPEFSGHYVQASYFLTEGDRRGYKREGAKFDRVTPQRPFLTPEGQKGPGAWELAYRISHLDLDDGMVGPKAGTLDNQTLGLNWYLSRNTRIMFNHVNSEVDDRADGVNGEADYYVLRFQTEF